jgi:hypothetical protein
VKNPYWKFIESKEKLHVLQGGLKKHKKSRRK